MACAMIPSHASEMHEIDTLHRGISQKSKVRLSRLAKGVTLFNASELSPCYLNSFVSDPKGILLSCEPPV